MATGIGYPAVMGAGKETTYRTGVAMTDRIPYLSESLSEQIAMIEDDVLIGTAGRNALDKGPISLTGKINTELRYTQKSGSSFCGVDLLLALSMAGTHTYASTVNTLKLGESPAVFATVALAKQVAYWEYLSCYFEGFDLSGKVGEHLKVDFDTVAYNLLRTGTTNGATQFSNLAASGGKRVLFGDMTFRLGDTADALASGDNIGLKDFKLTLKNNLTGPQFSSPDNSATHTNGLLTIQPHRNGFREVMLEFTLPRYESSGWGTQLETWKAAGTALQFKGLSSIDSAAKRFELNCPHVIIEDIQSPVSGPEVIETKVKCRVLRGVAVPNTVMLLIDGSTTVTEEFVIEMKNSTDGRTAVVY